MTLTNIVVTAYCCCKLCTHGSNVTADGHKPKQGVTCAASRSIPFGTILHIPGIGQRTVQDRLARRYDNRVDIYFASHKDALQFGKQTKTITIK